MLGVPWALLRALGRDRTGTIPVLLSHPLRLSSSGTAEFITQRIQPEPVKGSGKALTLWARGTELYHAGNPAELSRAPVESVPRNPPGVPPAWKRTWQEPAQSHLEFVQGERKAKPAGISALHCTLLVHFQHS